MLKQNLTRRIAKKTVSCIFAIAFLCGLSSPEVFSSAKVYGDELQWKLESGQSLRVSFVQNTSTETTGIGKPATIEIQMTMDLRWQVGEVDDRGNAKVIATFERLKMSMRSGEADAIAFDSADAQNADEGAQGIADAALPCIGMQFSFEMTASGDVSKVQRIGASNDAAPDSPLFSDKAILQVLEQPILLLPDRDVSAGDTWTREKTLELPVGTVQRTTDYTYQGPDPENEAIRIITLEAALKLDGPEAKSKLKEQNQSGELRFDRKMGHVVGGKLYQELLTESIYRDRRIEVRSTSQMQILVTAL